MSKIHVECLPDEKLVKVLTQGKKSVIHHSGKSRVFHKLQKSEFQVAMVDEDPGSSKSTYEKNLIRLNEGIPVAHGVRVYKDQNENKILMLEVKLENWIIRMCKESKISMSGFKLSADPDVFHDELNDKLGSFERLIQKLIELRNPGILFLAKHLDQ